MSFWFLFALIFHQFCAHSDDAFELKSFRPDYETGEYILQGKITRVDHALFCNAKLIQSGRTQQDSKVSTTFVLDPSTENLNCLVISPLGEVSDLMFKLPSERPVQAIGLNGPKPWKMRFGLGISQLKFVDAYGKSSENLSLLIRGRVERKLICERCRLRVGGEFLFFAIQKSGDTPLSLYQADGYALMAYRTSLFLSPNYLDFGLGAFTSYLNSTSLSTGYQGIYGARLDALFTRWLSFKNFVELNVHYSPNLSEDLTPGLSEYAWGAALAYSHILWNRLFSLGIDLQKFHYQSSLIDSSSHRKISFNQQKFGIFLTVGI